MEDEDLEMEEQNSEMPIEGMDLAGLVAANPTLAPFMTKYFGFMKKESDALQRQAANKQKQFEAARAEIEKKRYGAPTTSEQLFALGAAFLSPRRYRGFAGTLDKITPVLGQMEQAQRSAGEQRAEALEKLRREYLMGLDESAVAAARAQREALGKVLPSVASATKPRAPSTTSPVIVGPDARVRSRTTGSTIKEPPQDAIYQLQAYLGDASNTPQNKTLTRRAFDRKFGYGASDIYGGQQ